MMLPKSTPQMTRAELMALLADRFPDMELPLFCIVGIRGYYKRTMGKPDANDVGIYDDAIFLLTDNELHAFNANTDPSRFTPGIAKLKPGAWPCYRFDIHGGRTSQYPAICQRAGKVTVTRHGRTGEFTGMFGINIHRGGNTTTSSEGCQTIPPTQWDRFYKTAERIAKGFWGDKFKSETLTYFLIEQ